MRASHIIGAELPSLICVCHPRLMQSAGETRSLLELVFELFGQIFDIVGRPVFDVHAQVQAHA